jgi:tetratricopeptide (TPR) repeat protein
VSPGRRRYFREVNGILIALLGFPLAIAQAAVASDPPAPPTNAAAAVPAASEFTEKDYRRLLEADDAAADEIDKWILGEGKLRAQGAGISSVTLQLRVEQRLKKVEDAYRSFLLRHSKHARARLAFGSFLNDQGREHEAAEQWGKAKELEPNNPAAWNNLANFHGHQGPVEKAFDYYQKAIELAPFEAVYYHNLAVTVYLHRKAARAHFKTDEDGVFDKSLALYRKALKLQPNNFELATDYAQSYYGIKPPRIAAGIEAWQEALKIARDDFEREGVEIHLARFEINAGAFKAARERLTRIKDERYKGLVERVTTSLNRKEAAVRSVSESGLPASEPSALIQD